VGVSFIFNVYMSQVSYFTKEGLDKLREELNDLKGRGRSEMAKAIQEAREKGDLSENAEYDAAKDAQGLLELSIAKLEQVLASARVIDESQIDTSKVQALTTVKIKNLANGATMTYTLVSEKEADLKAGKISVSSPIGSGLLGKKVGDCVEITVPSGIMRFEILEISL
jgi:transcription elongation factor GreA